MESKRIGRPTKATVPGERVSLGLKVTSNIKKRLDKAARASGRTQSQEAEFRLERSFDHQDLLQNAMELAYGRPLAGVLLILAKAIKGAGENAAFGAATVSSSHTLDGPPKWLDIPYAYDQAVRAANRILEAVRPLGDAEMPKHMRDVEGELNFGSGGEHLGDRLATVVLEEVVSGRSQNDDQKRVRQLNEMLGPLAERLKERLTDATRPGPRRGNRK